MMSCVRVAVAGCSSYERKGVENAVGMVMEELEPIGIGSGDRVLVKPNLLSAREPREGVTTHPAVVAEVVKYLAGKGAKVLIGDSPCNRRVRVEELWERTGMAGVARETGAELVSLDGRSAVKVGSLGEEVYLTPYAFDVDAVVSVPKLKTHGLTQLTCGVKNLFGLIPGYAKLECHKKYHRGKDFSRLLAAVLAAVRPKVTVADAIVAMDGAGPSHGGLVNAGLVLGGKDAAALDAVCAHLMGFKEGEVGHVRLAGKLGVGEADLSRIEVVGEELSRLLLKSFKRPKANAQELVPEFVAKLFHRFIWVRPHFTERCTGCGVCVENCPAGALKMGDGKPMLTPKECIECFCCDESCPHDAVELRHGPLARFFV